MRQAHDADFDEGLFDFDADEAALYLHRGHSCASRAGERIEDDVAWAGAGSETAVYQGDWLLGGMLAELLFFPSGGCHAPHRLHLLAAVFSPHLVVVERVLVPASLARLARPQDDLGGVGERATPQVGWGVGLLPDDVVEESEPVSQEGHADDGIDVEGSRHPDSACGLQHSVALGRPLFVELVVCIDSPALVPVAFVHADHASPYAGDASVGQQVGRVGPHAIDALIWYLGEHVQSVVAIEYRIAPGRLPSGFYGLSWGLGVMT